MKLVKKCICFLLTAMMVLGMVATVSANTDVTVSNHTFKAYQIFQGTQAAGTEQLGQIEWGNGVNEDTILSALQNDSTLGTAMANCDSAAKVAEVMSKYLDGSAEAKAFAKVVLANLKGEGTTCVNGQTGLDAGYYLVVDTTDVQGKPDVQNVALLQLTNKGTFEIAPKSDIPSVEKKVDDKNDSTGTEDTEDWWDSADYDIGDMVPFKLTATLPKNLVDYKTYKLVFHDKSCDALTIDAKNIKVWLDFSDGTSTEVTSGFAVSADDHEFDLTIADVKTLDAKVDSNTKVRVLYSAKLESNAAIGAAGNKNTVTLEFSNKPDWDGKGDKEPTGETPKDTVIVFTYKLVADKVDEDGTTPLEGAGFTLYKWYKNDTEAKGEWKAVGEEVKGEAMTTFVWKGIDDGEYKLVETTIPAGYNKMADQFFTVTATHDKESDDPQLTALDATSKEGSIITFTIDVTEGQAKTTIINKKGSTLPETGGMGTTIFYILGSLLVLGAGVLLVARKRMTA